MSCGSEVTIAKRAMNPHSRTGCTSALWYRRQGETSLPLGAKHARRRRAAAGSAGIGAGHHQHAWEVRTAQEQLAVFETGLPVLRPSRR